MKKQSNYLLIILVVFVLAIAVYYTTQVPEEPEPTYYTLSVTISPPGSGSVTMIPDNTNYLSGTSVTVSAQSQGIYTFSGWTGDIELANPSFTVIMDKDISVVANFIPEDTGCTVATRENGKFDMDGNGLINYNDVLYWNSNKPPEGEYDAAFDMNCDGVLDSVDSQLIWDNKD